jgi:hypothetical protein
LFISAGGLASTLKVVEVSFEESILTEIRDIRELGEVCALARAAEFIEIEQYHG